MQSSDGKQFLESSALAEENLGKINSFVISLLQQNHLDDLLWNIVESVGELLGFDDCAIFLRQGEVLVRGARYRAGDPQPRDHHRELRLRLGEGIVGIVAQTGVARIAEDTRQDPDYVDDGFGGRSELTVPILFENRVIGVLDTESRETGAYGKAEGAMLQSMANVAASRIASALAEGERRELVEVLEVKNEELERFVYTVSHDLKSPLVTIQGFLGLLEKDAAAGDTGRMGRDVERIKAAAENMGRLLNDLLRLSRVGRQLSPFEEVSLGQIARQAVTQVAGQIHERGVEIEIADDLPAVQGDERQLLEVLQNLIDNAVKFIGDQAAPRIEIGQRSDGGETVLTVRDNGIGIEERYHAQVFGLFDRLDKEIDGTGIGLALVKRIVDLHGGRVWVESEGVGTGSTFCLALPREGV